MNKKLYRIRKLTPREVGRLLGVPESDLDIMMNCGISNSQLYKMFGNSIIVDCMFYMFKNLFRDKNYTDENKLKVFTSFSGYDSQCMSLNRLGINYDLVGWSEIDKYAIQAHDAIFPQYSERNYGDISKIDWKQVPDFDLFTYSSPCTDISQAGVQAGIEEGSGTRSSLLWECRKAIIEKRPKYLLFENVKAITTKKFKPYFDKWCDELDSYGYNNFYTVLNGEDFDVPHHRERLFMISILRTEDDKNPYYEFPLPIKSVKKIEDLLDDVVDECYYMEHEVVDRYVERKKKEEERITLW